EKPSGGVRVHRRLLARFQRLHLPRRGRVAAVLRSTVRTVAGAVDVVQSQGVGVAVEQVLRHDLLRIEIAEVSQLLDGFTELLEVRSHLLTQLLASACREVPALAPGPAEPGSGLGQPFRPEDEPAGDAQDQALTPADVVEHAPNLRLGTRGGESVPVNLSRG